MADENTSESSSLESIFDSAPQTPAASTEVKDPKEENTASTESDGDSTSPKSKDEGTEKPKEEDTPDPSDKKDESVTPDADKEKAASEKKAQEEKDKAEKAKKDDPEKGDSDPYKKRFEDTAKWAREVNAQNAQLREQATQQQRALDILQKKVDGTWTDEDEKAATVSTSPEEVATRAVLTGKALADKAAAVRTFGAEQVDNVLTEYHDLFKDNPIVHQVIRSSDTPVHTAMDMVERFHFEQQYGTTPKEWVKNIGEEVVKRETVRLRKELLEEVRAGKSKKNEAPASISSVAGGKGDEGKLKEEAPTPLKELFS